MKTFSLLLLISVCIVLISCTKEPTEVIRSHHFNGKPMLVEYIDSDSNVVKVIEYYKDGKKKMEGPIKDDLRSGEWSFWYENGKLWSRGNFKNGKSNGRFLSYDENGMLFQESEYKDGIPDGKWAYYKNDNRIKEVYYKDGSILNEVDL